MRWSDEPYELFDEGTVEGITASAFRMLDDRDPIRGRLPLNDAEVLAELCALYPEMRWCPQLLCTIVPTGYDTYRRESGDGMIQRRILTLNDSRRLWAENAVKGWSGTNDSHVKAALKMADHATRASNENRVRAVLNLFKATCAVDQSELDREPRVLGTPKGVVDMETGNLCVEDGNDPSAFRVTMTANATVNSVFDSQTPDPRWREFILEIMSGDEERADYLQRALGYSCMGGNPEECLFVAYGPTTRNGKDTLLESVRHALGDYATVGERTLLTTRSREGGTNEALASLQGKRLVTISEPPKGSAMDEGLAKDLTACGEQTTSKKYGAQFTFKPQFTIWMNVNHLPKVSDDSLFQGERVRIIPFERHFSRDERDPDLKRRFVTGSGPHTVLRWLIEGYQEYRRRGLEEPASVREATERYMRTGGSTLDRFVRECCTLRMGARVENNMLQETYRAYCENVLDERPMNAAKLRAALALYGVTKGKSNGKLWWQGLELSVLTDIGDFERGQERRSEKGRIALV